MAIITDVCGLEDIKVPEIGPILSHLEWLWVEETC